MFIPKLIWKQILKVSFKSSSSTVVTISFIRSLVKGERSSTKAARSGCFCLNISLVMSFYQFQESEKQKNLRIAIESTGSQMKFSFVIPKIVNSIGKLRPVASDENRSTP